jgi:hypothetical protein
MGSGEMIALQTSLKRFRRYRLHTNVQACRSPGQTCCPVYKQSSRAIAGLFGSGLFCRERRLTGFDAARKIIRIRTKCPAADTTEFSTRADRVTSPSCYWASLPVSPFDSLTPACELVHAD